MVEVGYSELMQGMAERDTGLERERAGSDVARRVRPLRPCWSRGSGARSSLVGTWRSGEAMKSIRRCALARADQVIG